MNFLIIPFFLIIILSIGYGFNYINKFSKKSSTVIGFCLLSLVIYLSYYYFNLKINYIYYLILIIFTISISIIILSKEFYRFLKKIRDDSLCVIPIILFFFILYNQFEFNFFIFRGNLWDTAFYLEQSLLLTNYSSNELEPFKEYDNLVFDPSRTLPSLIISLIASHNNINIIEALFFTKIISLSLISLSAKHFADVFIKSSNFSRYIFSSLFPFTFFIIYVFETDAIAQLITVSICILLIILTYDLVNNIKRDDLKFFNKYIIVVSTIYVLYFEIHTFFLIFSIIYLIFYEKIYKLNKILLLKYLFFFILLFCFYTNIFLNLDRVLFWVKGNMGQAWTNYWGYYGAFLSGKESIIIERNLAHLIKDNLPENVSINHFINILIINHNNGYKLQLLNILPSISGYWHLTIGKTKEIFNIGLIYLILLNLFIIYFVSKNINNLLLSRNKINNLILSCFITFVLMFTILIFNGNYWHSIKLFFYNNFIFFILFSTTIKEHILKINNKNLITIIFMSLLPFFIYSEYNFGNGKLTTFPSSLHPKLKEKFNWNFYASDIKQCSKFTYIKKAKNRNHPDFHKERYLNIFIKDLKFNNFNTKTCKVDIKEKYIIEIIESKI
jgi:hypothetical protein